jgi:hypothetical protein
MQSKMFNMTHNGTIIDREIWLISTCLGIFLQGSLNTGLLNFSPNPPGSCFGSPTAYTTTAPCCGVDK